MVKKMNTKQGIVLIGIALLIVCAFTSVVSAKIWYVDDDGGPEINFTNIQDAVDNASAGDTVFVYNGTYYENIILKDGIRVQGEGADVAAIDGRDSGSVVSANGVGTDTVLDGFTVTNGDTDSGGGMYLEDSSPTISNNIFEGNAAEQNGGGISMWESSPIIISNIIRDNSAVCGGGISIDLYSAPQITNNLIIGNSAPNGGAIFGEGDVSPKIINNNICGNSVDGIHRGDGVSVFTITNNVIWGNGDDLVNCVATYSDIEDGDSGKGNVCADPMFVDAAGGDYHLQAGSPCMDAGTYKEAPSTDFDGNPRPIDGDGDGIATVDIGAFEYIPDQIDWWPMFRHDPRNTGCSTSTAPDTNNILWNYTTGGLVYSSSPAVANNKVYIGSHDHRVYCLNATTGELLWNYITGNYVDSSPAVANDKVYVGSHDRKVYCLNLWRQNEVGFVDH